MNPSSPSRTLAPECLRANWQSPLGPMVLAATPRGLCGLWFDGQRHQPNCQAWPGLPAQSPAALAAGRHLEQACSELETYFAGRRRAFQTPIDLCLGTPFQRSVWSALCGIDAGQTQTYQALAQSMGRPRAVRAVGAAVGRNPCSILVPCHRVLGSDGSLTGYAGGLPRKAALLELEGAR